MTGYRLVTEFEPLDETPGSVEVWFNREQQSWVVSVRDQRGYELEATYFGVRGGGRRLADECAAELRQRYGLATA